MPEPAAPAAFVSPPPPRPLDEIETWVFDLDNTLYPASCRIFDQIHWRMGEFIAEHFGVDMEEAVRIRRKLFLKHGTTLRGLMTEHGVDPQPFMDYVHTVDLSAIARDHALGTALAALPGRKVVFTNGSVRHAENILGHLGLDAHFSGIFDIEAAGYVPKPDPAGYDTLIRRFEIDPAHAAMVEDMAKNLEPAAALGMTTVWVRGDADWAAEGADAPYIHYVADDLTTFLTRVTEARRAAAAANTPLP
jgi:putative hydrolase of the HAD superfamily